MSSAIIAGQIAQLEQRISSLMVEKEKLEKRVNDLKIANNKLNNSKVEYVDNMEKIYSKNQKIHLHENKVRFALSYKQKMEQDFTRRIVDQKIDSWESVLGKVETGIANSESERDSLNAQINSLIIEKNSLNSAYNSAIQEENSKTYVY